MKFRLLIVLCLLAWLTSGCTVRVETTCPAPSDTTKPKVMT